MARNREYPFEIKLEPFESTSQSGCSRIQSAARTHTQDKTRLEDVEVTQVSREEVVRVSARLTRRRR